MVGTRRPATWLTHRDRRNRSPRRGVVPVSFPAAGRARRRADHRRGTPLQPAPDHPRRRDGRAEAAQERQGAGHRRRRPRQPGAALPRRRRRRHPRHRRVRRGRRVQPAAPDHPRPERHREVQGGVGARSRSPRPTRSSTWSCTTSASTTTTCSGSSSGYDLIVDGTDNFATRYMVNDAAYFLKMPYVWGSIYRFDGQASVFCADARRRRRAVLPLPLPRAAAAGHGPVAAPRAACWACSAPASARSRSTRRSSCSPASATRWSAS